MTLWDDIKNWWANKKEENIGSILVDKASKYIPEDSLRYNPLRAKIGDFVALDFDQYFGHNLVISEIDNYERRIGNSQHNFAQYVLLDDLDNNTCLRIHPVDSQDPYAEDHIEALVIKFDFEMMYDEKFHKYILPSGQLEVKGPDGNVLGLYNRPSGLRDPYNAQVFVIDSKKDLKSAEHYDYWDYVSASDPNKFYFVEMRQETGWFQMWNGTKISEHNIKVTRR